MPLASIAAQPTSIAVDPVHLALVIIDMQRDFLEEDGFGAALGNDVSRLRQIVPACAALLSGLRAAHIPIIHTREGHRLDLSDAPKAKVERGAPAMRIGDEGPMGPILIRGEAGHDIVSDLAPLPGEPVVDKPGKGAFYQMDFDLMLRNRGIDTLLVCGVTTEVCVHTTIREANDRGYKCIAVADFASYFPEFHEVGLKMIAAQGGIFGWVAQSGDVLSALEEAKP